MKKVITFGPVCSVDDWFCQDNGASYLVALLVT